MGRPTQEHLDVIEFPLQEEAVLTIPWNGHERYGPEKVPPPK